MSQTFLEVFFYLKTNYGIHNELQDKLMHQVPNSFGTVTLRLVLSLLNIRSQVNRKTHGQHVLQKGKQTMMSPFQIAVSGAS